MLAGLIAIVAAAALPASASAASCPVTPGVFTTAWNGGSGNLGEENWTNGTPTGSCDVLITTPGSDVITMTGGANMKSLTLGGAGSTPKLIISAQGPNTNLDAQPAGITVAAGASITLTCPPSPGECSGGPGGGAGLAAGSSPFLNAGTIKVDANSGTGAVVNGAITNTGQMVFEKTASLGGQIVNKGSLGISTGATVTNSGSSCGDTGPFVKNDTGGTISVAGTGLLSVINFEQGNGTTEKVRIPCGSLKYTGTGASEVRAGGGFNLSGEMQENQALTVSAESNNTNVVLQGNFTNKGSITLTCPPPSSSECNGGSGGGVGFNGNGKQFANAGAFTVAAGSGTGAGLDSGSGGTIANTGTMSFNQTAHLSGVVVNKGKINIADTKTVTSSGSSCGDTGPKVVNDTGGQINATGSGTLSVINYEQGAGTTSGALPVWIPCGSLKYTGSGASTVQVGGASMTGDVASGQTLRLVGQVNSPAFSNAGTIVFDQSASNPTLNPSGTVTNTGKILLSGPSANTSTLGGGQVDQTGAAAEGVVPAGTKLSLPSPLLLHAGTLRGGGTINGSVENLGGVVAPGESPGTLTLSGNYVQGPGGRLDVEVAGTGVGQFDALALGGSATLDGTLTLTPTSGYEGSSVIGDSVAFLTYAGSVTGQFAQTTASPPLSCPKAFATSNDTGAKALKATVVDSGAVCGSSSGGGGPTPPPPVPNTKLGVHPGPKVTTKKAKLKVKFTFSSNVAGATFQCKLDKGAYKACASPKSYTVKPGQHKFSVRAVGPGGTDATPATSKFKVVRKKG